jgi:hypothetical protein
MTAFGIAEIADDCREPRRRATTARAASCLAPPSLGMTETADRQIAKL